MKKSIPPIDELINRLSAQIEARHEGNKISESGKRFLKEKWLGNEEMLYETVKSMENKNVQYQNIVKTLDQRRNEFQCGVDFLGFPIYVVHEVVFQNVNVRPEFKNMEVPCQIFLNSRQYNVKQH